MMPPASPSPEHVPRTPNAVEITSPPALVRNPLAYNPLNNANNMNDDDNDPWPRCCLFPADDEANEQANEEANNDPMHLYN